MLVLRLIAHRRRAAWSRRRVQTHRARYCCRTTPLDELWRAWCRASEAEQARFLAEVEELPY
jgi:hypothetical protein